jgi:hypothetical protein
MKKRGGRQKSKSKLKIDDKNKIRHMALKIQALVSDRHTYVAGLNWLNDIPILS